MERFGPENFQILCDHVAAKDPHLKKIIRLHGYPPFWVRPNSFATLTLTILEQQVSLASAYAAYKKLKEKITITPQNLLGLSDDELRSCYFSRQKIIYARGLATAIVNREISLRGFFWMEDEIVRGQLKKLKGIGDWTVDVYLMHALRRPNVFPIGDLALVNSIKMIKEQPLLTREEIFKMSEQWQPYRSIASMVFWHHYIKVKKIRVLH